MPEHLILTDDQAVGEMLAALRSLSDVGTEQAFSAMRIYLDTFDHRLQDARYILEYDDDAPE